MSHACRFVDIRPVKEFLGHNLPVTSVLRFAVFEEPDLMGVESFVERVPVWLSLLRFEEQARGSGPRGRLWWGQ